MYVWSVVVTTLFLCCWRYGVFFQFLAIFFCLTLVMGVRAFLLPTESHQHQLGEGSTLLVALQARAPRDVMGEDSDEMRWDLLTARLCTFLLSARVKLAQYVSERQLCRRSPVKCENITASKQEDHLFFIFFFNLFFFFLFHLGRGKYDCLKSYFAKAECAEMQSKEPLWEEISVLYRVASWDYLEWISWETSRNFFPLKTDGSFPFKCFKSCGELKIEAPL